MKRDDEMGEVKSCERVELDDGRIAMRVTVEFYDGNAPDLTFRTVWDKIPVKIIICNVKDEP